MKPSAACRSKRRFRSYADAARALLSHDPSAVLRTYYCRTCRGFHVTSRIRRSARAARS